MTKSNILNNALKALNEELQAVGNGYPKSYALYGGRFLCRYDGSHVYSFRAPPVSIADGTPVTLVVGRINHDARFDPAYLVGYQGSDIIISSLDNPGLEIEYPALRHEPEVMLDELRKRLTERKSEMSSVSEAMLTRLFATPDPVVPGPDGAASIEAMTDAALAQPVSLIWTPPGTDQTGLISACALRTVAGGGSVLILDPTTAGIDAHSLRFASNAAGNSVVRVGTPSPVALDPLRSLAPSSLARRREPQVFQELDRLTKEIADLETAIGWRKPYADTQKALDEMEQKRSRLEQLSWKAEQHIVESASIVLCPLARAVTHDWVFGRGYDVVIVSNAHRAWLPAIVWVATIARKSVILMGDFRQAPMSVGSRSDGVAEWLKQNIFEVSGILETVNSGGWDPRLLMLRTQHTMHPQIARITNEVSYGGRLWDAPEVVTRTTVITAQEPEPGRAVVFYDIGHLQPHAHAAESGGSRSNLLTAALSMAVVRLLQSHATPSILLATPYGDQWKIHKAFIRDTDLLDHVSTTTLHRCAHPQHDALILDLVDSSPLQRVGPPLKGGWGSESMHQLNAALTSARGKIVVIGDWSLLQQTLPEDAAFRRFLDQMINGGVVIKPFPLRFLNQGGWPKELAFYADPAPAWSAIYRDIASASRRVVWNWPFNNADEVFNPNSLSQLFLAKAKRALALSIDDPARHPLVGYGLTVARSVRSEAGVQIDDNIFWSIGNSASAGTFRPFIRIFGERVALQISDLFGLNEIIPSAKPRPWVTHKPRAQAEGSRS